MWRTNRKESMYLLPCEESLYRIEKVSSRVTDGSL